MTQKTERVIRTLGKQDRPGDRSGERPGTERTEKMLFQEMEIFDQEIEQRKKFLQFGPEDVERLKQIHPLARQYAQEVIDGFYEHILSFEETAVFFKDPKVLEYVKQRQKEYFIKLTQGEYGSAYVEDRLKIGAVHERIGLPVKSYLGMYAFYLSEVSRRLRDALPEDQSMEIFVSLIKLVFLDIGLAIDTFIVRRERMIREQQQAFRELPTPVLQVRDRLLILPIVGMIDSQRARQITDQLLRGIRMSRAKVAVIDITGVPTVDSRVANHLVQTVEATRLVGAEVIVTGLSPEIAQTLVTLGVDLSRLNTVGDLQGGLEEAERLLGYKVVPRDEHEAA